MCSPSYGKGTSVRAYPYPRVCLTAFEQTASGQAAPTETSIGQTANASWFEKFLGERETNTILIWGTLCEYVLYDVV